MSAKDQIKQIVDYFKREPQLKDKTDGMAEGLLLGANLADEANERSKDAKETTLAIQEKYKEQILTQDLNPNKDPELVDIRDGSTTAGERIRKFEQETNRQLAQTNDDLENATTEIPLDKYEHLFDGNDISLALSTALSDAPIGATIILNSSGDYVISDENVNTEATFTIDKAVTIDFNNARVTFKVEDKYVFDLLFVGGENEYDSRIKLVNYFFKTDTDFIPKAIIRTNGAINSHLVGSMSQCKTSHSLIFNWKGYGTHIRGELRRNDTPRVIYLASSSASVHSFAFDIDVDITGNSGVGIETEGANGRIHGVIESCVGGGYFYNGIHVSSSVNISVHFEENNQFDIKLGDPVYVPDGSRNTGITNLIGSYSLFRDGGKNVLFGSGQTINLFGSMGFKFGALVGTSKETTAINEIGNFSSYGVLDEADRLEVDYTGLLRQLSFLQDLLVKGKIHTTTGFIKSDTRITLCPNGVPKLTVGEKDIIPPHLAYNLGGAWNRFDYIYGRYVNLISPNGSQYRISVTDNGEVIAVKQ